MRRLSRLPGFCSRVLFAILALAALSLASPPAASSIAPWSVHPVSSNAWPRMQRDLAGDLCFVDANLGWACGFGDDTGSTGVISHTKDGGATWTVQCRAKNVLFTHVQFLDASRGWAFGKTRYTSGRSSMLGGSLYRTTDGGLHWTRLWFNTTWMGDFEMATRLKGYVLSDSRGPVFTTSNGGTTLTRLRADRAYGGKDVILSAVSAVDSTYAWVSGAIRYKRPVLLRTTNGGRTWSMRTWTFGRYSPSVDFVNRSVGFCVVDTSIMKTTNGGTTWSKVYNGTASVYLAKLQAVNANNVRVLTQTGTYGSVRTAILASENGGKTWQKYTPPAMNPRLPANTRMDFMYWLNGSTGWIVSDGGDPYADPVLLRTPAATEAPDGDAEIEE